MNVKKSIAPVVVILIIIAAVIMIGIIGSDRSSETFAGRLYFFNETATEIVSEDREIKYKGETELAEAVIEALMRGPEESRHQRIIEKKAKLISVTGDDAGNVLVNFSREFITDDKRKDILAVYAVVKSLCDTESIDSVKVVIEGKDISTSDGSIIGYLTNQDINLQTDTYNSEMREVTLYFPQKDSNMLQKETRSIRVTDQQPIAQYIINELIKGTVNENLLSPLSSDTVLLSVETSDNICFLNFRASFLDKNSGSADKEKMTIFAIVDSLTELDSIDRVQFLMDGKRVDTFGNINIGSMFGRDESIIAY